MKPQLEIDHAEGVPVGRDPRQMTDRERVALGFCPRPLLAAIRDKCLDCCCGNAAEVRRCGMIDCPLWWYRLGTNPGHRLNLTEDQRRERADRLARKSRPKLLGQIPC